MITMITFKKLLKKILEKAVNHRYYRYGKNFSKYTFIGILWTILNIFLMWLAIDHLKFPTVYASSVVVIFYSLESFMPID